MPGVFVYRLEHDRGLAPNPFFRICTLAVCISRIRAAAAVGDIVIGTASYQHRALAGRALYVMRVTDTIGFDRYYCDFPRKRAVMNASRLRAVGDAFYHRDAAGAWVQEKSLHSPFGQAFSQADFDRDVGGADRILLSDDFTYWGANAVPLPAAAAHLAGRNVRYCRHHRPAVHAALVDWANRELGRGRIGMPIDWAA